MTQKDYRAVAKAVRETYAQQDSHDVKEYSGAVNALNDLCNRLADVLQADNPQFKRNLFLNACQA
jgi:hypothetical protein